MSTTKKNDLCFVVMSTSPAATSVRPRERFSAHVRNFWQRVSEGRQIEDLWTQFAADARASYGFYGSEATCTTFFCERSRQFSQQPACVFLF
jgi:hypothetical protein